MGGGKKSGILKRGKKNQGEKKEEGEQRRKRGKKEKKGKKRDKGIGTFLVLKQV